MEVSQNLSFLLSLDPASGEWLYAEENEQQQFRLKATNGFLDKSWVVLKNLLSWGGFVGRTQQVCLDTLQEFALQIPPPPLTTELFETSWYHQFERLQRLKTLSLTLSYWSVMNLASLPLLREIEETAKRSLIEPFEEIGSKKEQLAYLSLPELITEFTKLLNLYKGNLERNRAGAVQVVGWGPWKSEVKRLSLTEKNGSPNLLDSSGQIQDPVPLSAQVRKVTFSLGSYLECGMNSVFERDLNLLLDRLREVPSRQRIPVSLCIMGNGGEEDAVAAQPIFNRLIRVTNEEGSLFPSYFELFAQWRQKNLALEKRIGLLSHVGVSWSEDMRYGAAMYRWSNLFVRCNNNGLHRCFPSPAMAKAVQKVAGRLLDQGTPLSGQDRLEADKENFKRQSEPLNIGVLKETDWVFFGALLYRQEAGKDAFFVAKEYATSKPVSVHREVLLEAFPKLETRQNSSPVEGENKRFVLEIDLASLRMNQKDSDFLIDALAYFAYTRRHVPHLRGSTPQGDAYQKALELLGAQDNYRLPD